MVRDGSQMVEGKFCYLASRGHLWADDLQHCNIAGIEYLLRLRVQNF